MTAQQSKALSKELSSASEYIANQANRQVGNAYVGKVIKLKSGKEVSARKGVLERHFEKGNQARYGWPDYSKSYAKYKAKKYPGRPMMEQTGELKASVVGKGAVLPDRTGVTIRLAKIPEYGVYHVKGKGVPKRDWTAASADEEKLLRDLYQRIVDDLVEEVNRATKAKRGVQ